MRASGDDPTPPGRGKSPQQGSSHELPVKGSIAVSEAEWNPSQRFTAPQTILPLDLVYSKKEIFRFSNYLTHLN